MATCRSCGAQILWANTPKGKAIPLDAVQVPHKGNVRVNGRRGRRVAIFVEAGQGNYQAHFATCPDADAHRKERS